MMMMMMWIYIIILDYIKFYKFAMCIFSRKRARMSLPFFVCVCVCVCVFVCVCVRKNPGFPSRTLLTTTSMGAPKMITGRHKDRTVEIFFSWPFFLCAKLHKNRDAALSRLCSALLCCCCFLFTLLLLVLFSSSVCMCVCERVKFRSKFGTDLFFTFILRICELSNFPVSWWCSFPSSNNNGAEFSSSPHLHGKFEIKMMIILILSFLYTIT